MTNNYKLKNKVPVIISLTTSPTRINNIKPVIDSILNQTIQPNSIYLNLPFVYKRTSDKFNKIPDFLNHPKIQINYVEDIGPITKILPTLRNNFIDDPLIISIDDDTIYGIKMIEIMLKYHQAFPNSVLTGSSYKNYSKLILDPLPHRIGNMVEGFSGIAYPYKMFKNMDIDLNIPKECYFSDDFIISNYINNKNIPIITVRNNDTLYKVKQLNFGFEKDALHRGAGAMIIGAKNIHNANYSKCANYYNNKNELSNKLKYFLN
jgi:hypothetical protein